MARDPEDQSRGQGEGGQQGPGRRGHGFQIGRLLPGDGFGLGNVWFRFRCGRLGGGWGRRGLESAPEGLEVDLEIFAIILEEAAQIHGRRQLLGVAVLQGFQESFGDPGALRDGLEGFGAGHACRFKHGADLFGG